MERYFSYERISTSEERSKQKFDRQEKALARYAEEQGIEFLVSFKEDKSGKNFTDRKEWQKLDKLAVAGDTIVFKDLTRFTREAEAGYEKYMELMERGVNLVFLDNSTLNTDYIKNMMQTARELNFLEKSIHEMLVKILLASELTRAEQERLTISKRTKDGIAASEKASGRKPGQVDKLSPELRADIQAYLADRRISVASLIQKHGISRNTIKKYAAIIAAEQKQ